MKRKNFLDKIDVKTPCNESWDEMNGNETVRFCSHCAKNVHDISAMTRQKAEQFVKKSNGNLCVRYVKTPTGKLITEPPKFTQIKRNATIAASVLATSLTFTTLVYAQSEPIKPKDNVTQTNKDKSAKEEIKQGFATVSGVVKDANDAVIQKAKVILRNTESDKIRETLSNSEGYYEFKNVEPSVYELSVESMGFKKLIWQNIKIENDTKFENTVILEVGETTMGFVATIEEPITTAEIKPIETFQEKKVTDLPRNPETSFMGDMTVSIDSKPPDSFFVKLEPIKPKKKKKKN
jgi:Carboxypeptidase regulatory-like domain